LLSDIGDFVIKRSDGQIAYQLAVVIDDAWQSITEVVRGCDLLDSTPRQIYLQEQLAYTSPGYAHIPVIINAQGNKLSKQTGARAIDTKSAGACLVHALSYLNQQPPNSLELESIDTIWSWAMKHWQLQQVCNQSVINE
jgi:glutamyl-Q tRNA(Asp) synthetase